MIHTTASLEETYQLARRLLETHPPENPAILLKGDLGSGKTALAQGFAQALGIQDVVRSPTFTLVNIYQTNHQRWRTFVHADLYRFERVSLEDVGLDEWLNREDVLVCIEWPERAVPTLMGRTIHARLEQDHHLYQEI